MELAGIHIDMRVAQLLCSRLCHDLVGPAGAVNAGLELLDEDVGADAGAAFALMARSANLVTDRLAFFRIAFGFGGAAAVSTAEVRRLAAAWLADSNVALDWQSEPGAGDPFSILPPAAAKLALTMVLMAVEALPRGGSLGIHLAGLDEGTGVALVARGQGARIKDDVKRAMASDVPVDELSARNIHAYYAVRLAAGLGAVVEAAEGDGDEVQLATILPRAG